MRSMSRPDVKNTIRRYTVGHSRRSRPDEGTTVWHVRVWPQRALPIKAKTVAGVWDDNLPAECVCTHARMHARTHARTHYTWGKSNLCEPSSTCCSSWPTAARRACGSRARAFVHARIRACVQVGMCAGMRACTVFSVAVSSHTMRTNLALTTSCVPACVRALRPCVVHVACVRHACIACLSRG